MIAQSSLSYGQLYQLFGYNQKLNYDAIINELLYSISDVKYFEVFSVPYSVSIGDVASYCSVSSYHSFDKTKLPQYLEHKTGHKLLMRIDARLRMLSLKRVELKKLGWFEIRQWIALKREIMKLSSQAVPIKDVFAFFAYKAGYMGLSIRKLHKLIVSAAENYRVTGLSSLLLPEEV